VRTQRDPNPATNATLLTKQGGGGGGNGRVMRTVAGATVAGTLVDGLTFTGAVLTTGGGLSVSAGHGISVRGCQFLDNANATRGAGIDITGAGSAAAICDSLFQRNVIDNSAVSQGGAIFADSATLDLLNCSFVDNVVRGVAVAGSTFPR